MNAKIERIGVRLEPELKQKLEQLIENGKFKSISEVVRTAILKLLKEMSLCVVH